MLFTDDPAPDPQRLAHQIASYVGQILHTTMKVEPESAPSDLPVFLTRAYSFYRADIVGQACLLMLVNDAADTPGDIAKHVRLVEAQGARPVIVGISALSARDRSRLIGQRVSFIVPGNQFYAPELGMDLREHFRTRKAETSDSPSPAAQAVFFHYVLRRNEAASTPSELARDLNYSPMSIGRAFDDLVAIGLAVTEKHGRERHLQFRGDRRELMESVRSLLQSPVRSRKLVWGPHPRPPMLLGGESALSELTDLSPPKLEVFAIAAIEWKGFAASHEYQEHHFDEPDFAVETWSYDPAGLADRQIADPLSLYAQFRDHEDERVAMAAEQLLERVPW